MPDVKVLGWKSSKNNQSVERKKKKNIGLEGCGKAQGESRQSRETTQGAWKCSGASQTQVQFLDSPVLDVKPWVAGLTSLSPSLQIHKQ